MIGRPSRQGARERYRMSVPFWVLAFFLCFVFLTGGSARGEVQSLTLLRPAAICVVAYGLWIIERQHVGDRRALFILAIAIISAVALYLVPLPPTLWRSIPGREIVAQIDDMTGVGPIWRPLTMSPSNSWNAFFALFMPLAVLLIGVRLGAREHMALLPFVLAMGALSAFIGALQVVGDPDSWLYLYSVTNRGSAVGLFANRNHAAVFLALLFPILAVYVSQPSDAEGRARLRLMLAVVGGLFIVPLILVTGSRGGLIGAAIGLISLPFLSRSNAFRIGPPASGKRSAIFWVVGLAVPSLILLTVLLARAQAFDRLFSADQSDDSRFGVWGPIVQMAGTYMPFGSGFGSFEPVYQIQEPLDQLRTTYLNHAHNDFLEVYLTGGWLGVGLMLACAVTWAVASWRAWQRRGDADYRPELALARLGSVILLILAVASVADYPMRTPALACLATLAAIWLSGVGKRHLSGQAAR